jgi:hypothetical protein
MKALRAFGRFWYDFIIGDDWKIAAAVVIGMYICFGLMTFSGLSDAWVALLSCLVLMALFVVSVLVDVRRST